MFGLVVVFTLNQLGLGNAMQLCSVSPDMGCFCPAVWESVFLILTTAIILVAVIGLIVLIGPDLISRWMTSKATLLKIRINPMPPKIFTLPERLSIEESGEDPPNLSGFPATASRPATVDVVVNRTSMALLAIALTTLFVISINRRDLTRLAVDVFCTRNQASTVDDNLRYPVQETGEVGDILGHPDDVAD